MKPIAGEMEASKIFDAFVVGDAEGCVEGAACANSDEGCSAIYKEREVSDSTVIISAVFIHVRKLLTER